MECCNGDDPLIPSGDPKYQGMVVPQHFQSYHQAPPDKYLHAFSPQRNQGEGFHTERPRWLSLLQSPQFASAFLAPAHSQPSAESRFSSKPFPSSPHDSIWVPQVLMNYSSALPLLNPVALLSSHLMNWGTEKKPNSFKIIINLGC